MTGHANVRADAVDEWPALRVADWSGTRDTLHMWTQVVGKLRLAAAPMVNHWWQVLLYVTARGLSSSAMPFGRRYVDMEFDLVDHELRIRSSDGGTRSVALAARPVAEFGYHPDAGQFLLPYEAVRRAPDPDAMLLEFFQDTYEAAADCGAWDRATLEVGDDDRARMP